jgi:hypothetical protein
MITWIVLGSIAVMLLTSLYVGWKDSEQIDILIEFKYLSNPWFNLGISFESIPQEDHKQEELVIGFFFINVVFVFFKEIDA